MTDGYSLLTIYNHTWTNMVIRCCSHQPNDDETVVYDLGEANDPDMAMKMLSEPDVINMRKEAGVDLESQEVLSTISKHKIW